MRYPKFLLFNALGCCAWASIYVSLGFGAGESWRMAAEWAGFAGKIVGSGLLLAVALVWLWRWRARHKADIKQRCQVVAEHPRILALRRIEQAPQFTEVSLLTRDFEASLHAHYNRQRYWVDERAGKKHPL
jgi:hypothetical protein